MGLIDLLNDAIQEPESSVSLLHLTQMHFIIQLAPIQGAQ